MEHLFDAIDQIAPVLEKHIDQDELNGRLSEPVIAALRNAGLYKLFLPAALGGFEADPLTAAKIVEKIAVYNAAAAWSVMVGSASGWWNKGLPAEGIDEIFTGMNGKGFIAGAPMPPMRAERAKGGFRVSGKNTLCSNAHEATWVMASAIVMNDGQPVMHDNMPEIRLIVLKADECEVLNVWQSHGMKATDSNDVMANDVFVPEHLTCFMHPGMETSKYYTGPLYRFPAAGINGCCLIVPVSIAIGTNAVEELKNIAGKVPTGSMNTLKEKGSFQLKLGKADALVRSARTYLHQTISECWDKVKSGKKASVEDRIALILAAAQANKSCVEAVDLVYAAAGTTGIYSKSKISRYFTDIQVIRQHGFACENRFETASQLMLGLQPDFPPALM